MGVLRADIVTHSSLEPTGSVLFDGTTDMLTIPSHGALAFGTADFSVECWVYFTSLTGQQTIVGDTYGESAGFYWYKRTDHKLGFYYTNSNYWAGETALEADTWYHLAAVRNNGVTSMYINGVHDKSATDTTNCTVTQYYIGDTAGSSSGEMFGYISNVRITRTAVYKQNFTVPKFELENIPGTILLCCQSSSSTTEAAVSVPGTLTAQGDPTATSFVPDLKKDITDIGVVFADNTKFDTLTYMVPPGGTTAESNRGRAVMMGGMIYPTASGNVIEYLQIQSGGMTKDFGDLPTARGVGGPVSSSTRGVICGGLDGPTRKNEIEYITIATTSNALDFGNLSEPLGYIGGLSNQTRGVVAGGNGPSSPNGTNKMEYITIASIGNATDFGDLVTAGADRVGAASPTRGIFFAGKINPGSWVQTDQIDYITIATTGNATDFGNTSETRATGGACSSSTRAVYGGGYKNTPSPQTEINVIDYVEIATTGNALDFGDLTVVGGYIGSTSNGTRGIFTGRMDVGPAGGNTTIDSVTIASLGDAVDWGEMMGSTVRRAAATVSDSHGGIS